jgi:hypothetical protein
LCSWLRQDLECIRSCAVAALRESRLQVVVAGLALQVEARMPSGGEHRVGQIVVAEGALPVRLIRRLRRAAELRRAVTTATEPEQAGQQPGAGRH